MGAMARMLGRIGRRRFTCDCCDWSRDNKQVRADEARHWRGEALTELVGLDPDFTDGLPSWST